MLKSFLNVGIVSLPVVLCTAIYLRPRHSFHTSAKQHRKTSYMLIKTLISCQVEDYIIQFYKLHDKMMTR